MGRTYCIVPGCESNYPNERKRLKSLGKKNVSLFMIPRDPDLFEKWKKAIPCNFDLQQTDRVCEFHFQENEVERFYVTKLTDGSINKIEKGRVTLKAGAVPSIFPNLREFLKKRFPKPRPAVIQRLEKSSVSDTSDFPETANENSSEENRMENFSYECLLQTVMSMEKPNDLWSISATSNFILYARWSEDYRLEKKVVIEKDLHARLFLREIELDDINIQITSCEDVVTLLEKVENCRCAATHDR